jgi:hypothetical protein
MSLWRVVDKRRWFFANLGSEEIREFKDLQRHRSCMSNFAGSLDRISATISKGRVCSGGGAWSEGDFRVLVISRCIFDIVCIFHGQWQRFQIDGNLLTLFYCVKILNFFMSNLIWFNLFYPKIKKLWFNIFYPKIKKIDLIQSIIVVSCVGKIDWFNLLRTTSSILVLILPSLPSSILIFSSYLIQIQNSNIRFKIIIKFQKL